MDTNEIEPMQGSTPTLPRLRKKLFLILFCAVLVLAAGGAAFFIYSKSAGNFDLRSAIPAVVQLNCYMNNDTVSIGSGTSFYYPNGDHHIMTNAHVVLDSNGEVAKDCWVYFPRTDGTFYESAYVSNSEDITPFFNATSTMNRKDYTNLDYAILKLDSTGKKDDGTFFPFPAKFPDIYKISNATCHDQTYAVGDALYVLGYPGIGGESLTVTEGIISGFDTSGALDLIKTSAKIDHGNSGGLAISKKDGCLIGIPTLGAQGELESIGYILPFYSINKFIGGMSTQPFSPETNF